MTPPDDDSDYYYGTAAENIDYGSIGTNSTPIATTVASSKAEIYRDIYNLMYVDGNEIAFQEVNSDHSFWERFCDAEYEFVYCSYGTAENTEDIDVNGKIAVIDRGESFIEFYRNDSKPCFKRRCRCCINKQS